MAWAFIAPPQCSCHSVLPIGPCIHVVHAQSAQATTPRCNIELDVTLQLCTMLLMVHLLTSKVLPAINLQAHVLLWEVSIHQAMPQHIALHSMLYVEGLHTPRCEPAHHAHMLLGWHMHASFLKLAKLSAHGAPQT